MDTQHFDGCSLYFLYLLLSIYFSFFLTISNQRLRETMPHACSLQPTDTSSCACFSSANFNCTSTTIKLAQFLTCRSTAQNMHRSLFGTLHNRHLNITLHQTPMEIITASTSNYAMKRKFLRRTLKCPGPPDLTLQLGLHFLPQLVRL